MTSRAIAGGVPPFMELAGHPLRWQMLVELARSDRQVHELTAALGRPQGLVSYHLGRLRAGGLVSARRSSFDGRAAYYRVHLQRCGELLAATAAAIHPGLASVPARADHRSPLSPSSRRQRPMVLFVCTGNGARSQIAEALLRERAGDRVDVVSAGSHPKPVHPNARAVLAERGIDISEARSKSIDEFTRRRIDYVVTLCDKVREICPEFRGGGTSMHWSMEDPSRATGNVRSTLPVFRALADDLESRIDYLLSLIDSESNKENQHHVR